MSEEELIIYKKHFKHVVWLKSQLSNAKNHIRELSLFDKNGSHKDAILKAIARRDKAKTEFETSLNGFDYIHLMKQLQKATALSKRKNKDKFHEFKLTKTKA